MTPPFDALNELGRWLVAHLWPLSIELALLTAVVVTALAAFRVQSPTVRHLFWCLVLLKPLATILVASPVTLYGFLELQPARYGAGGVAPRGGPRAERAIIASPSYLST